MVTKEEIKKMNEETDKKMLEYKRLTEPKRMEGILLKKCPKCKIEDSLGIFISLKNPCFIACRICSEVLTQIEIKDLSTLY